MLLQSKAITVAKKLLVYDHKITVCVKQIIYASLLSCVKFQIEKHVW